MAPQIDSVPSILRNHRCSSRTSRLPPFSLAQGLFTTEGGSRVGPPPRFLLREAKADDFPLSSSSPLSRFSRSPCAISRCILPSLLSPCTSSASFLPARLVIPTPAVPPPYGCVCQPFCTPPSKYLWWLPSAWLGSLARALCLRRYADRLLLLLSLSFSARPCLHRQGGG